MKIRVLKSLPVTIIYCMLAYCWYQLSVDNYEPTIKHILALILIIVNTTIYFLDIQKGILFTGIYLLAASCSVIAIEAQAITHSFSLQIGSLVISSPSINYSSLLLLILYCILNYATIIHYLKKINNWFKQLPK
jgi:hypothetical protein